MHVYYVHFLSNCMSLHVNHLAFHLIERNEQCRQRLFFYNLIFISETYILLTEMNMHISKTSKQIYGIQHNIHLNVIALIFFTHSMLSLS